MNKIVVKLGGSLISTSDQNLIDFEYLDNLKKIIIEYSQKYNYQFALVVGGGFICRKYQNLFPAGKKISDVSLDWVGIATINLNAEMMRSYFEDIAEDWVLRYKEYFSIKKLEFSKVVMVCAANEPGHSSDLDVVNAANLIGSKEVFRLTDIDGIYNKDPDKFPDAKRIETLTWKEYFSVLGITEFTPGGHYPIDPIAAREAEKSDILFKVMDGKDLDNFRKALDKEEFEGTIVK
jgi:uridylate kinase